MPILEGVDGALNPNWETDWSTPLEWYNGRGHGDHPIVELLRGTSYADLYRSQVWVYVVVSKLTELQTALPLKVYRRADRGREDASDSPYGRLLATPSSKMDTHSWRTWMASTFNIYGEAICLKVRDDFGRPIELLPVLPYRIRYGPEQGGVRVSDRLLTPGERQSGLWWWFVSSSGAEVQIPRRDLVIWKDYAPGSNRRGMSKLEPLRSTLESETAAQRATSALWRRGGKPSFVLKHGGHFGNNPLAVQRLADQFEAKHGGAENWGRPLVLEEGMDALPLAVDDSLKYQVDARRLNREEVASVYKLPPPAIGLLERSTNNNIVELHRALYRDTMPPILNSLESTLDFELRDGRMGMDTEPDFGPVFYAEHLLDGVMRGSFEARMEAYVSAVGNGILSPAEVREMENRPFMEDSDHLLVNAAIVSLRSAVGDIDSNPKALAEMVQKLYLGTPNKAVISSEEARAVLNRAGADLNGNPDLTPVAGAASTPLNGDVVASLMGRLSRPQEVADVDLERLVDGMAEDVGLAVAGAVAAVEDAGGSVADLRAAIKELRI